MIVRNWQKSYATGVIAETKKKKSHDYNGNSDDDSDENKTDDTGYKTDDEGDSEAKARNMQMDLEDMTSIFLSTGYNLNDDVLMPDEVYYALSSIPNKPTNIEHVPEEIVGHTYAVGIVEAKTDDMNDITMAKAGKDQPYVYDPQGDSCYYGETDKAGLDNHAHNWWITMTKGGKILAAYSSWDSGHRHEITAASIKSGRTNPGGVDNHTHTLLSLPESVKSDVVVAAFAEVSNKPFPDNFHVITKSYLYKSVYPDVVNDIMTKARAGKKFVSMETFFDGFDYLVDKDVVSRNDDTQFLDACLRANGGKGVFANKSVKRVLRNLHFGGQGIVDKPANPKSKIIASEAVTTDEVNKLDIIEKNRVYNISEHNSKESLMSTAATKTTATEIAAPASTQADSVQSDVVAKKEFDALKANYDALSKKHEEVVADFKKKEDDKKAQDDKDAEAKKAAEPDADDVKAKKEKADMEAKCAEVTAALTATKAELDTVKAELATIKTTARTNKIKADLSKFDISEADLTEVVEEHKSTSEEVYAKFISKANRLFRVKSSANASISGVNTSEPSEADKAKEATKALETAKANAQVVPFSAEDDNNFRAQAKSVIGEIFGKKETK